MSQETLLQIQNLKVNVGETEILHGIDLDIQENEVHVLINIGFYPDGKPRIYDYWRGYFL